MHSFTKSRDPRAVGLTVAQDANEEFPGGAATASEVIIERSDAHTQTPDQLPRAPWLAGPGPIDCIVLRLPNTELFAHRVTFCIQRHGIRTADMHIDSQLEVAPSLETLRRSRQYLYAVVIDDRTETEELIGLRFLLKKDALRFVNYTEAVHQIGEDFVKLKDSPWNRQRIMKFFLDPMLNAIEPTLEDFNYFKNYLKRGLRS